MPAPRLPRSLPRGLVFPSSVVVLSVVAVGFALVVFVLTRSTGPTEREVTPVDHSQQQSGSDATGKHHGGQKSEAKKSTKSKQPRPEIKRSATDVVVFNNSGITGLAADVGATAHRAGWDVVGTDNWYGSIPTNTVYYPKSLADAGKQLALDLGIRRTAPSIAPMRSDRLTVILTGALAH